MREMKNKVLVILASYNGAKYIKEQIDSILFQKDVLLDIKIFDDVSKDQTVDIVKSFFDKVNVEVIKNKVGSGCAANNFLDAIKSLSGNIIDSYDYIAFSDQDDIWDSKKLRAAIEMLQKDKSSLYCSNLTLWDEKTGAKSIIKKSYDQKKYDFLFEGGSAGCTYVFTNDFCHGLKEKLQKIDYYNWRNFSHDWFVYFFARIGGYKVSIDSNAYIDYRIHENNVHGQMNKKTIQAVIDRFNLVRQGWYPEQIKGFIELIPEGTKEREIYKLYLKNYFSRLYMLFSFNFELMRDKKKFIQFFIVNLIPIK